MGYIVVVGCIGYLLFKTAFNDTSNFGAESVIPKLFALLVALWIFMAAIQPYMKALFFNLAWNNTHIAGQQFRSSLTKWGMVKLG